jgi:predicted O-methyltransferase YrrM
MFDMKLDTSRMIGRLAGPHWQNGAQVNYLYGLRDLCERHIKPDMNVLEIGCHRGVSSSLVSSYCKRLDCVDINYTDEMKTLVDSTDNIYFHQNDSSSFLRDTDHKYDFIYLDAVHSYDFVKRQIKEAYPALSPNGVIGGHDYHRACLGVMRAVNYHFKVFEVFNDSSWVAVIKHDDRL